MTRTDTATAAGTFAEEDTLPRVPLPTLEDGCARFLRWCAPLLDADQLTATETAVAALLEPDGPGRRLYAALAAYEAGPGVHSWLDDFWRYRYLGRRDRIALNANFFFYFQHTGQSQLDRAAGLIAGSLALKHRVDTETLPVATLRGAPLSMQQYRYLFSATRIPGEEIDSARTPYSDERPGPSTERHVLVFRRGRMFRLDVIGPDGVPHTCAELRAGLQAVLDAAAEPAAPGTSVGSLTTKARAEWAASRRALLELDPANAEALDTVERALFCVSLEDVAPTSALEACDQLLHGESGNRWFDKSVTLVVFADGAAGVNGEHCKLDGTTIVAYIDFLFSAGDAEHEAAAGARSQGVPGPAEVTFTLDDALRADVEAAHAAFADYAAATAGRTVSIKGFTATTAKELGCSPDAFAQLAFQLAHQRAKGHLGATYESIATRAFHHGRTEAMRVVTPEIVRFVAAMDDPAADADTRRAAFRAAAAAHVARAKECQAGAAPEQLLWELELIQRRRGAELGVPGPLALYTSPGWTVMRDDYLSTSSVPSPHVQFFGFGSTSPTCIGVGYALMADRFDIYLSTPRAVGEQMPVFAARLQEALDELRELLADHRLEREGGVMRGDPTTAGRRKADFTDAYRQPDPREYFASLSPLDYQIPQRALPVVRGALAATGAGTVVDLCCSYGINAALLRHDLTFEDLSEHYAGLAGLPPEQVAAADRAFLAGRRPGTPRMLGVDVSGPAVDYAVRVGLLDAGFAEDLEAGPPSERLAAEVRSVDMVLCTGGVGYIGAATFDRLLGTLARPDRVWMVVFVLRMFPYDEIAAVAGRYGLVTERMPATFRQRRFADRAEQAAAVQEVRRLGLDPTGLEADGWYHAECYVSRPAGNLNGGALR